MPWIPPYRYVCSENPGHLVQADAEPRHLACPIYVHGSPCPGVLKPQRRR